MTALLSPHGSSNNLDPYAGQTDTPTYLPPMPNIPRPNGSTFSRELSYTFSLKQGSSLAATASTNSIDNAADRSFGNITPIPNGHNTGYGYDQDDRSRASSMSDLSDISPDDPSAAINLSWELNSAHSRGYYYTPKEVLEGRKAIEAHRTKEGTYGSSSMNSMDHTALSSSTVTLNARSTNNMQQSESLPSNIESMNSSLLPLAPRASKDMRYPNQQGQISVAVTWRSTKPNVKHACVVGSFSNWTERISLVPTDNSGNQGTLWSANLKLKSGVYFYKFVVDGEWLADSSQETRVDNRGITNNILRVGLFEAEFVWDKTPAQNVLLTGSFDNWSSRRKMDRIPKESPGFGKKTNDWFRIRIPLPPGLYEYKFIVDSKWFFDVTMPTSDSTGIMNNVIGIGTIEHTFVWNKTLANSVELMGSFNKWKESIPMQRQSDNTWKVCLGLPPGRYEYKFKVDKVNWWFDVGEPFGYNQYGSENNIISLGL
eukprot:CAMPEP_0184694864 /NCGR_PEP_ID=MMETSP0313-20130426/2689_1 /TAXON_ID=2792 /ORGANISM="Porphyridium aerugineum, Strain SAG 1380-2" /LENGTH=484 /DNA_ID=CAMNT_0027153223 /DNA_START=436 /DNA_END=1890 /DNA_ORIENTATION=+